MPAFAYIPGLNSPLFRGRGKRVRLQSISDSWTCRNPVIEGDVGAFGSSIAPSFKTGCRRSFSRSRPVRGGLARGAGTEQQTKTGHEEGQRGT